MQFKIKCKNSKRKIKSNCSFLLFDRSHEDPSPSAVGEHLQPIVSQAIYNYAAMVHENLESPHQNKLDHDVQIVLGSSDPPPGFGCLYPRFYYLEQKRPVSMGPLRVCIVLNLFLSLSLSLSLIDLSNEKEIKFFFFI